MVRMQTPNARAPNRKTASFTAGLPAQAPPLGAAGLSRHVTSKHCDESARFTPPVRLILPPFLSKAKQASHDERSTDRKARSRPPCGRYPPRATTTVRCRPVLRALARGPL